MSDGVFMIAMGALLGAWLVVNTLRIRAQSRRRTKSPHDGREADKRRMKLKALIVQMSEANDGLAGMALLAHDYQNHAKYIDKFMTAYYAALDMLEPK